MKYLIANHKAHRSNPEAYKQTLQQIEMKSLRLILAPPSLYLPLYQSNQYALAAQDISQFGEGAFTGELPAPLLQEFLVTYVILGHSERREKLGEDNFVIKQKFRQALANNLTPILCVGDSLEEHTEKRTLEVLKKQIDSVIEKEADFLIAYEPIFAIGSGKVPSLNDIETVVSYLSRYTKKPILYGGSVNETNIEKIAKITDGALVGSASNDPKKFSKIIQQMVQL